MIGGKKAMQFSAVNYLTKISYGYQLTTVAKNCRLDVTQ